MGVEVANAGPFEDTLVFDISFVWERSEIEHPHVRHDRNRQECVQPTAASLSPSMQTFSTCNSWD
jgi:hypothetical protein